MCGGFLGLVLPSFLPILLKRSQMCSLMTNNSFLGRKIEVGAVSPVRGSVDSAGFDLSAAYETIVPAHGKAIIKTDLAIATPPGCYARIAPRSGLAWKKHIDVGAGVVDADYRGNVGVILFNLGNEDFAVAPGDRVAQLILEKIDMSEAELVDELPATARGIGGFGSTGVTGSIESIQKADEPQKSVDSNVVDKLLVKFLGPAATLPVRGSVDSAGFDLSAAYETIVPAHGKAIIKTDLAIATPPGCYARIAPRSGLAWKKYIDVGAGVVDADYRGNVGVILFNLGDEDFAVAPGDRVAQLILEKIDMSEAELVDELPATARGIGGFGSTGVTGSIESIQKADEPQKSIDSNVVDKLLVKFLGPAATLPVRGSVDSAGFDLSAAYETIVPAHGKAIIKTDLAIATPPGCYARIAPRSGLAWKKHIDVGAGVVDADYRGNVGVILFNLGNEDFAVAPGDRVAQLILEKIDMSPVEMVGELPDTACGGGGFGSTGISSSLPGSDAKRMKASSGIPGSSS